MNDFTQKVAKDGTGAGRYGFELSAQAVPEPAEYAMLLAGLGVVGMAVRRRRMNVNQDVHSSL